MSLALSTIDTNEQLAAFRRRVEALSSRRHVGPIGFEFGKSSLRAVQFQFGGQRPRLLAAVSEPYPIDRHELLADVKLLRSFVRGVLADHGFRGNRIVTCTPADNLRLLSLEYPVSETQSEEETIIDLLSERVSEDLSDLVIDYVPARGAGNAGNRMSMVALAPVEKQIDYIELLRKAGLYVLGLEIGPIAIRRLVENVARLEQTPNVLVVNCGALKSYLTVISGRRLMLDRGSVFGEDLLSRKLGEALDMTKSEAESLLMQYGVDQHAADEVLLDGLMQRSEIVGTITEVVTPLLYDLITDVERVSSYVHAQLHGANVQQIFLLGSIARWPGADALLEKLLKRPVKVLNPLDSFYADPQVEQALQQVPVASMAIATGCALSELS